MQINPSFRLASLSTYAFKEINDAVQSLKNTGIRPIDFGVGDPSEPSPEFVQKSLTEAAKKHAKTGYPSYIGSQEFRIAAVDYMKRRFGINLDPNEEITSNLGSKESIFNFPEAFVNPGDIVICPSPGYPPFKNGTIFAEGKPYYTPLLRENDFLVDYKSIPEKIAQSAKIIWINYPNSPTGAVASKEYYEGLINWANGHNIIIAADEGCYIDIYFDEKPMSILEVGKEGIIAFYSLSKRNNMTGYRVGFLAGDKKIIDIYKQLKTNIDSGTPNIIQEAAILALSDDKHNQYMSALYDKKRTLLYQTFEKIGFEVKKSKATFYIWQKTPNGMTDIDFAKRLLRPDLGIVVTPGSLISEQCEGGINPGDGYVRFALMPTIEEIKDACEKLEKVFG